MKLDLSILTCSVEAKKVWHLVYFSSHANKVRVCIGNSERVASLSSTPKSRTKLTASLSMEADGWRKHLS